MSVREATVDEGAEGMTSKFELLTPHFTGHIPLSAAESPTIRAGQRVTVSISPGRDRIGEKVYDWLAGWLERRGAAW